MVIIWIWNELKKKTHRQQQKKTKHKKAFAMSATSANLEYWKDFRIIYLAYLLGVFDVYVCGDFILAQKKRIIKHSFYHFPPKNTYQTLT